MSNHVKDSVSWNLDYNDIMDIFKNNLKIENSIKSVQSIFLNKRFSSKINYKPYFQRNYVWDKEKASYFIESILLGTEVPPLVLFKSITKDETKNEVIDGRQRYETMLKFLENELVLQNKGLHRLYTFSGYRYVDFDEDTQEIFNNTKLRILQCSVSNEPSLTNEKEDKIKKEIFKRYNSGITPLKKEENARAEYIDDVITLKLKTKLENSSILYKQVEDLFMPKSKLHLQIRDKINILLDRIRTLLSLTEIPIYNYAKSSHRYDIIRQFYNLEISHKDSTQIIDAFLTVVKMLIKIKKNITIDALYNNVLLYESLFWGIFISLGKDCKFTERDIEQIAKDIEESSKTSIFWDNILNINKTPESIFELTGSHYRNATIDRYRFFSNYFGTKFNIDFCLHMKESEKFNRNMGINISKAQLSKLRLIKPDPVSITIDDILTDMSRQKFLVRPKYQRSEIRNIQKSSYLLESIMLGIKIPPIYIYKRSDKVKEVIDGQQRILTLIGFLGKTYVDENGNEKISDKHKFKLSGLKILKELNGMNIDAVSEQYPQYIDNILDFSIDVVEIDAAQNPDFNNIDLFLRLNTKPFPIRPNTFEMWNAYVERSITQKIKDIVTQYEGNILRSKDTRMSNEELITALAYLNHQKKFSNMKYADLLTIYLRDNHICARISSKDRITKMLENLSLNGIKDFEKSIDDVSYFIHKLCNVVGKKGEGLSLLLGTNHKTDQNFYFLWIILENISLEFIEEQKKDVFNKLQTIFNKILQAPKGIDVYEFVDSLSNLKW